MPEIALAQITDSHAYLYEHPEALATGWGTVYRAAGVMRVSPPCLVVGAPSAVRFLDCGDTLHGTRPAAASGGAILPPLWDRLGIAAMTGHGEFA